MSSLINRWIETAITRNVKFIDLTFRANKDDARLVFLPSSLITYKSLEALRLDLSGLYLRLPNQFARFAALRVLELKSVSNLQFNLIPQFLESCPLLEDLSLVESMVAVTSLMISSSTIKTLRIRNLLNASVVNVSCLKLEFLEYEGYHSSLSIEKCCGSLKKAVIVFKDKPHNLTSSDLDNIILLPTLEKEKYLYNTLFVKKSNAESLSLNFPVIQCLGASWNTHRYLPALLRNVKTLEITITIDAFNMDILIQILICSPNLKSLHMIIQKEFLKGGKYWDFDVAKTRIILRRHLKRVKFLAFIGEKQRLDIALSLLEHGNALEEMVFSWRDFKYTKKTREAMH